MSTNSLLKYEISPTAGGSDKSGPPAIVAEMEKPRHALINPLSEREEKRMHPSQKKQRKFDIHEAYPIKHVVPVGAFCNLK